MIWVVDVDVVVFVVVVIEVVVDVVVFGVVYMCVVEGGIEDVVVDVYYCMFVLVVLCFDMLLYWLVFKEFILFFFYF